MANNSSPDYRALYLEAEERRILAEEESRQAQAKIKQAEKERDLEREQTRPTSFGELIRYCHDYLSQRLRTEAPSRSTTGKIPPPIGKCCPLRLRPWTDCSAKQGQIYRSVCDYLQPSDQNAELLFQPRLFLKALGDEFSERPISSEQDLESYERFCVENHVRDIIAKLCTIDAARDEFRLGKGVQFDNHANALDTDEEDKHGKDKSTGSRRSRPDQFCIHRVDGEQKALLMTVEFKPPHKLSVENLRAGLRPMDFWREVVRPDSVPTEGPEKLRYNAAWLTGSAVVQEYHVMIQEGLEYSYLTNGLALVLLKVDYDDPSTLYYHLCEPDMEVNHWKDENPLQQPVTSVARVLCLCLMSFQSRYRDQEWRNAARAHLPEWKTSFDHTRSQIPASELQHNPPGSEYTASEYTGSEPTASEYIPSSSPVQSPLERQIATRSRRSCAPSNPKPCSEDTGLSSDSEADDATKGRKRRLSQILSSPASPSVHSSARRTGFRHGQGDRRQKNTAPFCTQRCLLGLQRGGKLDMQCPNIGFHQQGGNSRYHLIRADAMVKQVKQQLDENIDHGCTPIGHCGASGVPFKVTCATYGYTVVGKGTTRPLWHQVSREADIYGILSRVQGSAVPVFLGKLDLDKFYFVHGAGEIRHMLLMAWGGDPVGLRMQEKAVAREISRSTKSIRLFGILHNDLRPDNILWNAELGRALIIDFHCSKLDLRPIRKRQLSSCCGTEGGGRKRPRVICS